MSARLVVKSLSTIWHLDIGPLVNLQNAATHHNFAVSQFPVNIAAVIH